MQDQIELLHAREILDSRGNPTVQVRCQLSGGAAAVAGVPSGASTGSLEAAELRDGDATRYGGKGVQRAVANVNEVIFPHLKGKSAADIPALDAAMQELDGTKNLQKLGANAVLGVSLAAARAAAAASGQELFQLVATLFGNANPKALPAPMLNVINGGAHADSGLGVQEFMLVPQGFASFADALRAGTETFHCLKNRLAAGGHVTAVGDEGGFAPHLQTSSEACAALVGAIADAGYAGNISLALDVAATELYSKETKSYALEGQKTAEHMVDYFADLAEAFPMFSIEDPLDENDTSGWQMATKRLGKQLSLVGDDLLVTNPSRIQQAIDGGWANALLVKPNQIGTLSQTLRAVQMAKQAGWRVILSHRSGETTDTSIADIAVGVGADGIKTGAPCRGERVAKYNRLLEIEDMLGGGG